jgi:hypothetical protein
MEKDDTQLRACNLEPLSIPKPKLDLLPPRCPGRTSEKEYSLNFVKLNLIFESSCIDNMREFIVIILHVHTVYFEQAGSLHYGNIHFLSTHIFRELLRK